MADDLEIVVGADLTPFEQAMSDLPDVAQQAAQQIDSALGSIADESGAATAGLQSLDDALQGMWQGDAVTGATELETALQSVSETASEATPHIEELGQGAQGAGEAATEAGSMFGELGEQLIGVLEKLGLMITAWEALKEVMEAAAAEQSFVVSMTALTHSAEDAEAALAQMDETALQIPVAFESLLQATQKLTAFGVALNDIPDLLHAAADAAAATGNAFDNVVAGLERVQVTGQVMARSLVQMGLTWEQVAADMGTTVDVAQAAFKKGAQSAEEDVRILVDTIEQNYAGLSEKLASTLGGSWQIFKNQLTELGDQIGQILAPIAMGLMQIVGGAFQTISDALKGMGDVLAPVVDFVKSLGADFVTFAQNAGIAALAVGALLVAFDISGWGLAVAAIGAVIEIISSLAGASESAADKEARLAEERKIQTDDTNAEKVAADNLAASLARHNIIVTQAGDSVDSFSKKLQAVSDDFNSTSAAILKSAAIWNDYQSLLKMVYPSLEAFQTALQGHLKALQDTANSAAIGQINTQYKDLQSQLTNAQAYLKLVTEQWKEHGASLGQVEAAQAAVDKASQALNGTLQKHTGLTKDDNAAIHEAVQELKDQEAATSAVQAAIFKALDASKGLGASFQEFANNVALAQVHFDPMTQDLLSWQKSIDDALKAFNQLPDAQQRVLSGEKAELDARQQILNTRFAEAAATAEQDIAEQALGQHAKTAAEQQADTGKVMAAVWASVLQPMQDADAEATRINEGLQQLGIETENTKKSFENAFDAFAAMAQAGDRSITEMVTASEKLATSIGKTVEQQQRIVDLLQQTNAPMQAQLDAQQKLLTMKQQQGDFDMQDAATLIRVQATMYALHNAGLDFANDWVDITHAIGTAFDSLGQGLANAIVTTHNFGQAFMQVIDQMAQKILTTLINDALSALASEFLKDIGLTKELQTSVQSVATATAQMSSTVANDMSDLSGAIGRDTNLIQMEMQGVTDSAGSMAQATTQAGQQMSSTMQQTAQSVQGSASAMVSSLDLIANAITAIASIFSAIELMHTNTLLGRIEESTRRTDITIEGAVVTQLMFLSDLVDIKNESYAIDSNTANSLNVLNDISAILKSTYELMAAGGFGGGTNNAALEQLAVTIESQNATIAQLKSSFDQASANGSGASFVILGGGGGGGAPSFIAPQGLPSGSTGVYTGGSGLSSGPSVVINSTVQAGTVVGAGGIQQLSTMVGQQIVQQFRAAGLKV